MSRPAVTQAVVLVEGDDALVELCGVTMLERLLRTLQRSGIRNATVLTDDPGALTRYLARPSRARAGLALLRANLFKRSPLAASYPSELPLEPAPESWTMAEAMDGLLRTG